MHQHFIYPSPNQRLMILVDWPCQRTLGLQKYLLLDGHVHQLPKTPDLSNNLVAWDAG